jgi:signal transduction histidine kinase
MSLRARVTLLLSAAIILAVGFAGIAARETALQPLRADLMRGQVHEALQIALELRQGATLEEVREEGGPQVSLMETAPASPEKIGPGQAWKQRRVRGRKMLVRRDKNPAVAIQLHRRWLLVESAHTSSPKKLFIVLGAGGLLLLGAAVFIGSTLTRPLRDTQEALLRVAEGDLSQRLPVRGGEELEAVAESFNAMTERISTMLRSEKQLMAGISHELRTPLTRLRLQTELLRDEGIDSARLEKMEANLEAIDCLVGEFLERSRLDAGASVLETQTVHLHVLAQTCLSAISTTTAIEISGESRALQGDPARLKRVISTLLENALKYGQESSIHIQVGPNSFQVSDRGPGVSEAELPRLFEAFFRGSEAHSHRGYGIGLSMAQQILGLHGGRIGVANRPGGGLVVAFVLPDEDQPDIDHKQLLRLPFEV